MHGFAEFVRDPDTDRVIRLGDYFGGQLGRLLWNSKNRPMVSLVKWGFGVQTFPFPELLATMQTLPHCGGDWNIEGQAFNDGRILYLSGFPLSLDGDMDAEVYEEAGMSMTHEQTKKALAQLRGNLLEEASNRDECVFFSVATAATQEEAQQIVDDLSTRILALAT